jgi:cytochrome c peroxidase
LGVPENPEIFDDPLRHITFRRFFKTLGVANYADIRRDPGFYGVSKLAEDRGRFKTPSLREVGRTAPYMHNGVFKTLEEVLEFYSKSMSLKLDDGEKKDLVEFLGSLSSPERKVRPAALPPYALRKVGEN